MSETDDQRAREIAYQVAHEHVDHKLGPQRSFFLWNVNQEGALEIAKRALAAGRKDAEQQAAAEGRLALDKDGRSIMQPDGWSLWVPREEYDGMHALCCKWQEEHDKAQSRERNRIATEILGWTFKDAHGKDMLVPQSTLEAIARAIVDREPEKDKGDSEEVLFTRSLAEQAREIFESMVDSITHSVETHLREDQETMVRTWLDAYVNLDKLRTVDLEFSECRAGWKRGSRACKECGTHNRSNYFRDYVSKHFDDIRVDLEVCYISGLFKNLAFTWSAGGLFSKINGGPSASMHGYASTYEKACEHAEQAAEKIVNSLRQDMGLG